MLQRVPVIAEPNRFEGRFRPEVVDVPVGALGWSHVMPKTTTNASRPKCAANVHVIARLEPQVAEPPNSIVNRVWKDFPPYRAQH
jgi:hypothetical protein